VKRRFDVATVYATLARVSGEDPERRDVYAATQGHSARYVVDGAPNCLVAVALAELGCSRGVLRALDREGTTPEDRKTAGVILTASRHLYLRRFTPAALALLASVQRHQDTGRTWSEALALSCAPKAHFMDARYGRPWMPLPEEAPGEEA
jgi:hypothetical protein